MTKLINIPENTEALVNCDINLEGQRITLAHNVTLNASGGSIENGTLVGTSGAMSAQLMNSTLNIEGGIRLVEPTFVFEPEKWNLIQGTVSIETASSNTKNLNHLIKQVHKMGATTFEMDVFDGYFFGGEDALQGVYFNNGKETTARDAVLLPSNFHFKMSKNTYLRMQPSNSPAGRILGVLNESNITISGGNLIGDRAEHDYSKVYDRNGCGLYTHEYAAPITLLGAHDVVIDDVYITESSADAIHLLATGLRNTDGSLREGQRTNERITIKNSILDKSRRNGISLTEGQWVTVENNIISDTGLGEVESETIGLFNCKGEPILDSDGKQKQSTVQVASYTGTLPRAGIDLESFRIRKDNGDLEQYERISHVEIKNNRFTQNGIDVILFTTDNVVLDGNEFGSGLSSLATFDVTISNNKFIKEQNPYALADRAIKLTSLKVKATGEELVQDIEVKGNEITGFATALVIGAENIRVSNNTILDFDHGVILGNSKDNYFHDNSYTSTRSGSKGIVTQYSAQVTLQNTLMERENVNVSKHPIEFKNTNNNELSSLLTIDTATLNSQNNQPIIIDGSKNITLQNSQINVNIDTKDSENITLKNNFN